MHKVKKHSSIFPKKRFLLFLLFFKPQLNITLSLEQTSNTGNLEANLLLQQHILDIMSRFMENKSVNPKIYTKTNRKKTIRFS